jgi:RNA polymerase sigma-32 factor
MNKPVPSLIRNARRVRTSDMLSAGQERHLLRAWQEHGDIGARDHLVRAFSPLAASVARRFRPRGAEPDPDLVQQANIGLMKAADRFDPGREVRFATYAIWWMRAEVQSYSRATMSVVRRPQSARTRMAAARVAGLDAAVEGDPDMDQSQADARLADMLGTDVQDAVALRAQVTGMDSSLNTPAQDEDGADRMDLLVDPASVDAPAPLQRLQTATLRRVLVEALSALPDREREIIVATQVTDPPATLEGLGVVYGISKERVRQLRERGFERLRDALDRRGLSPDCVF